MKSLGKEEERAKVLITALLKHFGYEISNGTAYLSKNAIFILDKTTHEVVYMFWLKFDVPFFLGAAFNLSHKEQLINSSKPKPWLFYSTLDDLDIQLTLMGIHP